MRRFTNLSGFLPATLFLALLVSGATTVQAAARIWPGASPCDTTLQACLIGAATDDTVQVQSNGPIDEALNIDKPLTLVAAPGYRPVLTAGRSITTTYTPGAGVNWSMDIEGFTVPDGVVYVYSGNGNATVTLRHLDVTTLTLPPTIYSSIYVWNNGSGQLTYEIAENRTRANTGNFISGIFVDGNLTIGTIHDNRVSATAAAADSGIGVRASGANSSTLIYANQVSGNIDAGLALTLTNAFTATVLNNAFECTVANGTAGIDSVSYSGSLTTQIFNNTIVGCAQGLQINAFNNVALSGRLANNLIANSSGAGLYINSTNMAGFSNDHNLIFGNASNSYTPGPGTITTDPLLARGAYNPRLGAGSPAIDAADSAALSTLLVGASVPEIDADGLRRFKGSSNLADIGAFEYGDNALIEFATSASGGVIDNSLLNGNTTALPQLIQDQNPDTYVAPAYDSGLTALNYASGHFAVIGESDGAAPTANSAYNVFVPAAGNGAFLHSTTARNVFGFATKIDNAYINSQPARIVLSTHRSTSLFNHSTGVIYLLGYWFIVQLDDTQAGDPNFPTGILFHIYAQDPSLNAFVWTVPADGTFTSLDHPLLNGEPCGRVYATGDDDQNPHPIDLKYQLSRWTIVNIDGGVMPAGALFNVVVDEAATEFCRYDHIFHNGFEGS